MTYTPPLNSFERALLRNVVRPLARRLNKKISASIPRYALSAEHLKNAKLITTREELLKLLPASGIAAEIGVDQGNFSHKILSINKPEKLHLIDNWGTRRFSQAKRKSVEERFAKEIGENKLEINLGLSTEVVNRFKDNYFDWIYIDTTHSYQVTIAELKAYCSKVKPGGIIAGHDYIVGNWDNVVRYGVIEAVHEFCTKQRWEIIYITQELDVKPSFAIRRIM